MGVFYWVVKAILYPFLRLVFRPWAEGTDNVPREGPAIIASNHLSFSDHFFGPLLLPRKVVYLAKAEYFTGRGIKGLISKAFFRGMAQIPSTGRVARPASGRCAPGCASWPRATCWASIPRAPAPPTAGCTAARPASPGWPWRAAPR